MPAKLITAPAVEPVTVAEARAHLYVTHTDDDTLIGAFIAAARQDCEHRIQRALVTQTWERTLDSFPAAISLPMAPLASVTSVKYIDGDGNEQTLAASAYYVDTDSEPGQVLPAYGASWPTVRDLPNAVRVRYVAGYGADGSFVPAALKQWILLRVGALYENRESAVTSQPIQAAPREFADGLLDRFKLYC